VVELALQVQTLRGAHGHSEVRNSTKTVPSSFGP
jgi:hypothetical protein